MKELFRLQLGISVGVLALFFVIVSWHFKYAFQAANILSVFLSLLFMMLTTSNRRTYLQQACGALASFTAALAALCGLFFPFTAAAVPLAIIGVVLVAILAAVTLKGEIRKGAAIGSSILQFLLIFLPMAAAAPR